MDRELLDGRPMFVSVNRDRKSTTAGGAKADFKFAQEGVDKTKLFVRGLSADVTQDQLRVCGCAK